MLGTVFLYWFIFSVFIFFILVLIEKTKWFNKIFSFLVSKRYPIHYLINVYYKLFIIMLEFLKNLVYKKKYDYIYSVKFKYDIDLENV